MILAHLESRMKAIKDGVVEFWKSEHLDDAPPHFRLTQIDQWPFSIDDAILICLRVHVLRLLGST